MLNARLNSQRRGLNIAVNQRALCGFDIICFKRARFFVRHPICSKAALQVRRDFIAYVGQRLLMSTIVQLEYSTIEAPMKPTENSEEPLETTRLGGAFVELA